MELCLKICIINIFGISTVNGKDVDIVTAARKVLKPIKFENADPEMIKFKQWVLWGYELNDNGNLTKMPYSVGKYGRLYQASPSNPPKWLTFEEAKRAYESGKYDVDGVGFVLTENDPYCCVDFDHVINPMTDEVNLTAQEEASAINSRVEKSPSGTGWHEFLEGKMPKPGKKKELEDGSGREMYCSGRYITMTFDVPLGFPSRINNSEAEGLGLFKKYWPEAFESNKPDKTDSKTKSNELAHASVPYDIFEPIVIDPNDPLQDLLLNFTDDELIEDCLDAPNGWKFKLLLEEKDSWKEAGYGSESGADLGFCNMLAFHTNDYNQIYRIVKSSALWDNKWERKNEAYARSTIGMAIRDSRWG